MAGSVTGSPKVKTAVKRVRETGRAETVVLHPADQEEFGGVGSDVLLMRRSCLNCGVLFVAVGRFNRLCSRCGRKSTWPD